MSAQSGWIGGPRWTAVQQWGSGPSNSARTAHRRRGRRSSYACGVERGSLGEIMAALHSSWVARRGRAMR